MILIQLIMTLTHYDNVPDETIQLHHFNEPFISCRQFDIALQRFTQILS